MEFPKIENGRDFETTMVRIWDGDLSHLYYEWHNARKAAEACNAVRLWAFRTGAEPGYAYQFPDGSRVAIATHGGAVTQINRHKHFA